MPFFNKFCRICKKELILATDVYPSRLTKKDYICRKCDDKQRAIRRKGNKKVTKSSGNVFADLGLPNPEKDLEKSKLIGEINSVIKERGLRPIQVSGLLEIFPSRVLELIDGKISKFTLEELIDMLNKIGENK